MTTAESGERELQPGRASTCLTSPKMSIVNCYIWSLTQRNRSGYGAERCSSLGSLPKRLGARTLRRMRRSRTLFCVLSRRRTAFLACSTRAAELPAESSGRRTNQLGARPVRTRRSSSEPAPEIAAIQGRDADEIQENGLRVLQDG